MAIDFPSEEWAKVYVDTLNSPEYKEAGATWEAGKITLVIKADPAIGLAEDTAVILDLHKGVCNGVEIADLEKGNAQPFVITGTYSQWKAVLKGELDPIKAMMQGKLKLKGNLPIIVRHVKAAQVLVAKAGEVDTRFLDE